jgi:hypothetical protein
MFKAIAGSPSPNPWGRWKPVSYLSYLGIAAGTAGTITYAVLATVQTPVLGNTFTPLWAAALLLIAALELLYQNLKTPYNFRSRLGYVFDLIYYELVAAAAVVALAGWAAGTRFDVMAWFFVQLFFLSTGIAVTVHRRREVLKYVNATDGFISTKDTVSMDAQEADYSVEQTPMTVGESEIDRIDGSSVDKKPTCGRYTLAGFNGFLKFVHVVFMAFLANGGVQAAINYSYPPRSVNHTFLSTFTSANFHGCRGELQSVTLADNRTQVFHFFCSGTSLLPTIFLDSSLAHGTVDFYPIQTYLVALGRRVCVYDPPSFGWTGDLLANQVYYPQAADAPSLYCECLVSASSFGTSFDQPAFGVPDDSLFEAMDEGGAKKLNFLAWGGGGDAMLRYGSRKPEKVASMGLLDVFVGNR